MVASRWENDVEGEKDVAERSGAVKAGFAHRHMQGSEGEERLAHAGLATAAPKSGRDWSAWLTLLAGLGLSGLIAIIVAR